MIMGKRILSLFLSIVFFMLFLFPVYAGEADPASDPAGIEEAALSTAKEKSTAQPEEASEDLDELSEQIMEAFDDVSAQMENVDIREILSYLRMAKDVLQSEDFRRLWNYEEFQELFLETEASMVDFIISDPELSIKIFITLGLDKDSAGVIVDVVERSGITSDLVRKIPIAEIVPEIEKLIDKVLERYDLMEGILQPFMEAEGDAEETAQTQIRIAAGGEGLNSNGQSDTSQDEME